MIKISADQLSKMSPKDIIAMFSGEARIDEETQVKTMTASCPTSITQGTAHTITVARDATKTGTPNYTYKWLLDGTEKASYGPTADTSHDFSYTFSEAAGSHVVKGRTTDSCAAGAKTADQECTINIVACPDLQTNLTIT